MIFELVFPFHKEIGDVVDRLAHGEHILAQ